MDPATAEPLPPLYASWLGALIGAQPPREAEATCQSCAMCRGPAETGAVPSHYFLPDAKCCTYVPRLPNSLVGGILADTEPDGEPGRESVRGRLRNGHGVTPLGIDHSPVDAALYGVFGADVFGFSHRLKCPHLTEDARCSIHAHRNATCTTWFCKHVRGAVGERFWSCVREWLGALEREVSTWCVIEAGFSAAALEQAREALHECRLSRPAPAADWPQPARAAAPLRNGRE